MRWVLRIHGQNPNAPTGSNSERFWVMRLFRKVRGNEGEYMDHNGNFHKPSSMTDVSANDTHIPIETPSFWRLLY